MEGDIATQVADIPWSVILNTFFSWSYWKLVGAFFVGAVGSLAYITALYFKFIGVNNEQRDIVLEPFRINRFGRMSKKKCLFYSVIGGFIAVVFQYDVPNFVAVQSLILGATWPAVVSQFLSGRMISPSREEIEEIKKDDTPVDTTIQETLIDLQKKGRKRKRT